MEKADYPCALDMFQRAHTTQPSSRTLAQVGLAEQALERWVNAEEHLSAALSTTDDRWVEKRRRVLEDSLARIRTHLGELSVAGSPAGAEVILDGEAVGTLPLPRGLRVVAGQHRITVRAPGYVSADRATEVAGGSKIVESIELSADVPVPLPVPVSASLPAAPVAEPSSMPGPVPAWRRALGGVAIGAGASLATLGGVWMWLDGKRFNSKAYDMGVQGPVTLAAGGLVMAGGIVALAWPGPATTNVAVTPTGLQVSGSF